MTVSHSANRLNLFREVDVKSTTGVTGGLLRYRFLSPAVHGFVAVHISTEKGTAVHVLW